MDNRKTIFTFVGYYLPGHNAGGPIRSVSNMVEALGDEFRFLILTSDRDLKTSCPYDGIATGTWLPVGKAMVMYLTQKGLSFWNILRLLRSTDYDLIYLNSFFARRFSMIPCFLMWIGVIPKKPIILAPKGEFSKGAIKIKYWRKKVYILITKYMGVYEGINWHVSSVLEKKDLLYELDIFDNASFYTPVYYSKYTLLHSNISGNVLTAIDIPDDELSIRTYEREKKKAGEISFCFLSRISPIKNLEVAIGLLDGLKGDIQYNIFGPIEDKAYWRRCEKRIETMPANIRIMYKGEVHHEQVGDVFSRHHFFLFPTRGENYGHVIIESLLSGCPVVISDQTPWRNLKESGVGWDLPLENLVSFRKILQRCIDMGPDEYEKYSALAKMYAINSCNNPEVLNENRNLFLNVLEL